MADALRNYLSSSPWTCSLNYMMLWLPKLLKFSRQGEENKVTFLKEIVI